MSTSRYAGRTGGEAVSDESGDLAESMIRKAGGSVKGRELISDDARQLRKSVSKAIAREDLDVVVLTGGTGVSTTDVTIESVRPLFDKEIEGFGEIFRSVSFKRIGAAAALSRATAGVANGKLVMCLPGSPDAVRTALELYLSEVPHVLHLARAKG